MKEFFGKLFGGEGLGKKIAKTEAPNVKPDVVNSGWDKFLKNAATVIALGAALEGCGPLLDTTPDGDWYNKDREAFPENKIPLSPEIGKTVTAEGRANVKHVIGEQFRAVPEVFWDEIKEVRLVTNDEFYAGGFEEKAIIIPLTIMDGQKTDNALWVDQQKITDIIAAQIGMNWYNHLSGITRKTIETLTPEGQDAQKGFGDFFSMYALYPEMTAITRASIAKFRTADDLDQFDSIYGKMKDNVFGGHEFQTTMPDEETGAILRKSHRYISGGIQTDSWQTYLESLRGAVDDKTKTFIDYVAPEFTSLWQLNDRELVELEDKYKAVIRDATEKKMPEIARAAEYKLIAITEVKGYNDPRNSLAEAAAMRESLYSRSTDLFIQRRLALELAGYYADLSLYNGDKKNAEMCQWYATAKKMSRGMYTSFNFEREAFLKCDVI